MFKKNTILFGVIQGLVFPVIFFIIFYEANELLVKYYFGRPPGLSLRFISILAIGANLIPILVANRSKSEKTMRGIMSATLIITAAVVAYFWKEFM